MDDKNRCGQANGKFDAIGNGVERDGLALRDMLACQGGEFEASGLWSSLEAL